MEFSRIAIKSDFEDMVIQYDHYRYMEKDIKELIENNNLKEAVMLMAKQNGRPTSWAKPYCEKYLKFITAKKDFESGKTVFVHY